MGRFNQDLLAMVRANVREPRQVEGDLFAMAACNDEGCRRLRNMLDEFHLDDLQSLAGRIIGASRRAMRDAIRQLPPGVYRNRLVMDGYEKPLTLEAALTIRADSIAVDYAGTSPASSYGINVVLNYTLAYTAFGVRCLVAPEVPNNAGSLEPITVSAPEGCVLNAKRPWAVAARHTVGHMLPDVVFGCLASVIKGGVPAEGASSLWNPQIMGDPSSLAQFSTVIFHCGGSGARPTKDGLNATAFPSGVRTIPVEATEAIAPVIFWRREFREGSAGAGTFRGGVGQVIELGGADGAPITLLCNFERINHPARGRSGGHNGEPGKASLLSGRPFRPKGRQTVPLRDRVRLELPGGAGYGPPEKRDPQRVADDVADGLVSPDVAESIYRVALTVAGEVDTQATRELRADRAGR
jgi:N-methylhydantoinase B